MANSESNFRDDPLDVRGIDPDSEALGPSDTSDSGSDVPRTMRGSDSDSQGTGERSGVEPPDREAAQGDLIADKTVDQEEAGLSHDAPDPVRNGGT